MEDASPKMPSVRELRRSKELAGLILLHAGAIHVFSCTYEIYGLLDTWRTATSTTAAFAAQNLQAGADQKKTENKAVLPALGC